jgi:hypothetical protein
LETLGQLGLACGVVECVHGLILLGNGRRGFALQVVAPLKEVLKCMEPLTHPSRILARRVRARHEAHSTVGGPADAVEAVRTQVVTMGFPGFGRAIRGQVHVQDGRPVCLNRHQEGLMAGKNLIAEIKHHVVLCSGEGRRQSTTRGVEACTERPHGVGLVLAVL